MTKETLTYTTIAGEVVIPSDKEVERVRRDNAKAIAKLNPARNAWAYWAKQNAKKGVN